MRPSRTFTPQTAQHAHQPLNATQNAAQRVMNAHVHRRVNARGHNSVQEKCGATARNASQPARRATQETRATHDRKAKRRRAGRRSATKPHNLHHRKQRGEKGSRRDSHPDPYHQSNVHTQPCGGERPSAPQRGHDSTPPTSGRSHCLSYATRLQPVSNYPKCPQWDSNPRPIH